MTKKEVIKILKRLRRKIPNKRGHRTIYMRGVRKGREREIKKMNRKIEELIEKLQ